MLAPMWRMNGLLRRMAGVLVLCALLLSNEVMCQSSSTDATNAPTPDPAAHSYSVVSTIVAATNPAPAVVDVSTVAVGGQSTAPGSNNNPDFTLITGLNLGPSGVTVTPDVGGKVVAPTTKVPDESQTIKKVVPDVKCIGEVIPESEAVRVEVVTDNCEASKRIIQEDPANWCNKENCNLVIFQEGNKLLVASEDASLKTLAGVLKGENLTGKLGVTNIVTPSSSDSSVFVGILVSGLLAALAIIVGYFKCPRRTDPKGVRLAEEAYPVDQENQGNTLVSVAPLNPPPETPEKPSVNGESPEAAKTQPPPPTNGHSTTKTADTEL